MALEKKTLKSSVSSRRKPAVSYWLCLTDAEGDLVRGKVYPAIPDAESEAKNYVRLVDESGEDYLYPAHYLFKIDLPATARHALSR